MSWQCMLLFGMADQNASNYNHWPRGQWETLKEGLQDRPHAFPLLFGYIIGELGQICSILVEHRVSMSVDKWVIFRHDYVKFLYTMW